jgi:hypothetical protein
MDSLRNWYIRNQDAITWFVIGWLVYAGLDSLVEERYVSAMLNFFLAYVNYKFSKIRL